MCGRWGRAGNQTFVAELTVPLRSKREVFIAVGQGPNKAEAERACCTAACEKLHDVGLLQKPNEKGATPPSTTLPTPAKPTLIHQVSSFRNGHEFDSSTLLCRMYRATSGGSIWSWYKPRDSDIFEITLSYRDTQWVTETAMGHFFMILICPPGYRRSFCLGWDPTRVV